MKKNCFILCIFFWFSGYAYSQSWINLGSGLDFHGYVLFSDSVSDNLFIGGSFSTADGHQSRSITAWNGMIWDTLAGGLPGNVITITRFQNYIYVGGAFIYLHWSPYSVKVNGFTRWNGVGWDSLTIGFRGAPYECLEYNNLLYCTGAFDTVGTFYSPLAVIWNGNNWMPIGLPQYLSGITEVGCIYQNELYIAGTFTDSTGTVSGCAKWNGNTWVDVGGNFGGLIHAAAVYHNELYFGGNYLSGPNSYLVKYDGTNFSQVGTGFHGNVWGLRVIDDKLFAVGIIDTAGGIPVSNIAMWDGNTWAAFSSDVFNGAINDVAVFNGELYVTGGFNMINSDTVNYIAKYDGWHLGEELPAKKMDGIKVYPNPTSSNITIEISTSIAEKKHLSIYNVLGEVVYKSEITNQKSEINVSGLGSGIYFVEVRTEKEVTRKKIIKL